LRLTRGINEVILTETAFSIASVRILRLASIFSGLSNIALNKPLLPTIMNVLLRYRKIGLYFCENIL